MTSFRFEEQIVCNILMVESSLNYILQSVSRNDPTVRACNDIHWTTILVFRK